MEKEALIQNLKTKSQIDNLSERTIDEVATLFLPQFADDEKINDESWNLPVQMLKTMSGQLRHDLSGGINDFKTKFEADNKDAQAKAIADAIAAAKAEWEKKNPKSDPKKEEKKEEQNQDVDQKVADALAKAMADLTGEEGALGKLSKQFSDFLTQQAEEKKQISVSNVRNQVREYLIGRGVEEDDYALEICLEKLEIGEKPDVASLKAKAEKDYETIYNRMHKNDGSQPFKGGGGGAGGMSPLIKSHIDRVAADAKDSKEYSESLEFAK